MHDCLQIYALTETYKDVRFHPHTSTSGVITGSCGVCSLLNFSHGPCYVTLITLKRLQHHYGAEASVGEAVDHTAFFHYALAYFIELHLHVYIWKKQPVLSCRIK